MRQAILKNGFVSFGFGCVLGLMVAGLYSNARYYTKRTAKATVDTPISEERTEHPGGKTGVVKDVKQGMKQEVANATKATSSENLLRFEDDHLHNDDTRIADALYKKVRVLCWIMTSPNTLYTKAKHVNATWGKRCNMIFYMSSVADSTFPAVGLNVSEGRDHLTAKTMLSFKYIYERHLNDADWFMKADDDTYVIVENLRYFLSNKNPDDPVYFGHMFRTIVPQGYVSGGAGYVLSREALKRWYGGRKSCRQDGGAEDAEMGKCLQNVGVKVGKSTDSFGRSRFHCFDASTHIKGHYPDWYYKYDAYGAKKDFISDYAVTFHYVKPELMYMLEFYVYHLRPFGIVSGHQQLNDFQTKTGET